MLRPYGFIACTSDTMIGGFARGAAATMASTRAPHSALPPASSSRNDVMRDINQSTAATTDVGLRSMRVFVFG